VTTDFAVPPFASTDAAYAFAFQSDEARALPSRTPTDRPRPGSNRHRARPPRRAQSAPQAGAGAQPSRSRPGSSNQRGRKWRALSLMKKWMRESRGRNRQPGQKLWDIGATIPVKFLGGSAALRSRVRAVADQWTEHANVHFAWVPSDHLAVIKISFDQDDGTSWSQVGRDALGSVVFPNSATMNLGWLTDDTDDTEVSRVVLHEFGHALGLIHEHQSPAGGIRWDKDRSTPISRRPTVGIGEQLIARSFSNIRNRQRPIRRLTPVPLCSTPSQLA
jgi:Matrixin